MFLVLVAVFGFVFAAEKLSGLEGLVGGGWENQQGAKISGQREWGAFPLGDWRLGGHTADPSAPWAFLGGPNTEQISEATAVLAGVHSSVE